MTRGKNDEVDFPAAEANCRLPGALAAKRVLDFTLSQVAVICATGLIDRALGDASGEGIIGPLVVLAFMVPDVMVSIRRLHDTDRSAWWIWVSLVPVLGSLALLALFCMEGTGGTN